MLKDLQNKLLSIPQTDFTNERYFEMMKIFYEAFPCKIIQLFQYSSFNGSFSGILSYEHPNVQSIAHIHETMKINTYIHQAIFDNKVSFFNDSKFQLSIGNEISLSEPVNNMLLIPFSVNGIVIGFMTGVNVQFEVTEESLSDIENFSDSSVQMLQIADYKRAPDFTERELLVMKYIANGYTTKNISNVLYIAESTVKYFLKNVMLKTKSKNRTEAVTKLFRMKLLH